MTCKNNWSDKDAQKYIGTYRHKGISRDLALRTYSARLLGSDPELVLHGGGNTSVKSKAKDIFGNEISVLHVKGSGWDLATIEPEGHPAVRLDPLLNLESRNPLSEDMVATLKTNLLGGVTKSICRDSCVHLYPINILTIHIQ